MCRQRAAMVRVREVSAVRVRLTLDHDSPRRPASWSWRFPWLCRKLGWTPLALGYSRSTSGGWHGEAWASCRRAPHPAAIVAAQAVLGSHWAREAYNLMRVHSPAFRSPLWRARAFVLYERHTSLRGDP